MVKENKKNIMIIIRDEKGNILESSDKIDIREMCRYPSEEYYEYKSKLWSLKELPLTYESKQVMVQIYINITEEVMEKKSLKKNRESGLIEGKYLKDILNKLAKKLKTTSKGITVILFSFDEEHNKNYTKETMSAIIKDLGDCIVDRITKDDYAFRLAENEFLVVLDNYNSGKSASIKADSIQNVVESKGYQSKKIKDLAIKPIIYFGIGTIGTTRITGNNPMSIINLARENLEKQKESKRETRKFLEKDKQDDVVLS